MKLLGTIDNISPIVLNGARVFEMKYSDYEAIRDGGIQVLDLYVECMMQDYGIEEEMHNALLEEIRKACMYFEGQESDIE